MSDFQTFIGGNTIQVNVIDYVFKQVLADDLNIITVADIINYIRKCADVALCLIKGRPPVRVRLVDTRRIERAAGLQL